MSPTYTRFDHSSNVCRSPYAEAAARILGLPASSCGVDVTLTAPAEPTGVRAAFLRGKDLSGHLSRSIFDTELGESDCLVAMDPSHLPVAGSVAKAANCQITLLGLWRKPPVPEIADPYGRPLEDFQQCFDEIDEALVGLIDYLGAPVIATSAGEKRREDDGQAAN